MKTLIPLLLLLAGCPPTPPTPHSLPDAAMDAAATTAPISCPASTSETPDGVCDGLFTTAKLCANNTACACVRCLNGAGCIDQSTQVYCVVGGCASDTLCKPVVSDTAKRPKKPPAK